MLRRADDEGERRLAERGATYRAGKIADRSQLPEVFQRLFDQWEKVDKEQWSRDMDQFERDWRYLEAHRIEWLERYPEEYVVVYGERLIAHGPEVDAVLGEARQAGLPMGKLANCFLTRDIWILRVDHCVNP